MNGKTSHALFGSVGQKSLFAVNSGCEKHDAIMHAQCAVNSARQVIDKAISENRE